MNLKRIGVIYRVLKYGIVRIWSGVFGHAVNRPNYSTPVISLIVVPGNIGITGYRFITDYQAFRYKSERQFIHHKIPFDIL